MTQQAVQKIYTWKTSPLAFKSAVGLLMCLDALKANFESEHRQLNFDYAQTPKIVAHPAENDLIILSGNTSSKGKDFINKIIGEYVYNSFSITTTEIEKQNDESKPPADMEYVIKLYDYTGKNIGAVTSTQLKEKASQIFQNEAVNHPDWEDVISQREASAEDK